MTICRWVIALLFLCTASAYAQFDTASVVGTVRDTTGAVTPDTTVTLTNTETGVSLTRTTNGEGVYEFTTVRPGAYVVTARESRDSRSRSSTTCRCRSARVSASTCRWRSARSSDRVEVTATRAARRDRLEPARPGDRRHRDPRAAAQRTRVFRRWRC